jgi:hypothetical protein
MNCMDAGHDAGCGGCGGSGCQSEDRFDRRGEHYTVEIRCTVCDGSGEADEDRDERRDDAAVEDGSVSTEAPL